MIFKIQLNEGSREPASWGCRVQRHHIERKRNAGGADSVRTSEHEREHTLVCGSCWGVGHPGAKQSAATLCEWSGVQPDVAVATQDEKSRRLFATPPALWVAALCASAPEDGFIVRWSPSGVRQTEICIVGVQPTKYAIVGDSQPPAWRAYGAYLCAQNSVFTVRSSSHHSDYCCDLLTTNINQKKYQYKNI